MLRIKTNVGFDKCKCTLALRDVTDFAVNKLGGFLQETDDYVNSEEYKISDGVFLEAYFLTDSKEYVTFLNEPYPIKIESEDVKPIFKDNFFDSRFKIERDGLLSLAKIFIITKETFDKLYSDTEEDYVYYDEEERKFYYRLDGKVCSTSSTCNLLYTIDLDVILGAYWNKKDIFSICNLRKCHLHLLQRSMDEKTDASINGCRTGCFKNEVLDNNLDMLRNSMAVLEYLIDCENYTEASVILEALISCSAICNNDNNTNYNIYAKGDCGCKN